MWWYLGMNVLIVPKGKRRRNGSVKLVIVIENRPVTADFFAEWPEVLIFVERDFGILE
jgi:hypothetical protein